MLLKSMSILTVMIAGLTVSTLSAFPDIHPGCNQTNCALPSCQCMSQNPPKNLDPTNIPQLVMLTFDDAITVTNYGNYTTILKQRLNPNLCPITMTFYITHEYNDYAYTYNLSRLGNEMAVHSVTHKNDQSYWSSASPDTWMAEIDDMRTMLSTYALIPTSEIKGHRAPFLQTGGNITMKVLNDLGMVYDNSLPTQTYMDPPLFPYTLQKGYYQDCPIPPCPSSAFSSPTWVVPMVDLRDTNGSVCNMVDTCSKPHNASHTLTLLKNNFERHYLTNRAPFGIYAHAGWFQSRPDILQGYLNFLDYLGGLDDVYIVSVNKVVEWMKNPQNINQSGNFAPFQCPNKAYPECASRACFYEDSDAGGERIMKSCVNCPDVYPWLKNPLGKI